MDGRITTASRWFVREPRVEGVVSIGESLLTLDVGFIDPEDGEPAIDATHEDRIALHRRPQALGDPHAAGIRAAVSVLLPASAEPSAPGRRHVRDVLQGA